MFFDDIEEEKKIKFTVPGSMELLFPIIERRFVF